MATRAWPLRAGRRLIALVGNSDHPGQTFPPLLDGERWRDFCDHRRLTSREGEILRLICNGLSNRAICEALQVRPDTLRSHIRATYRKLKCRNRVEVVLSVAHEAIRSRRPQKPKSAPPHT